MDADFDVKVDIDIVAGEFGIDSAWDDDIIAYVPVDPHQRLAACICTLPMGWSWGLYYCQSVLAARMRRASQLFTGMLPSLCTSLVIDGALVCPLSHGQPLCLAYVDSANVWAWCQIDLHKAMHCLEQSLE